MSEWYLVVKLITVVCKTTVATQPGFLVKVSSLFIAVVVLFLVRLGLMCLNVFLIVKGQ